MLRLFGTPEVVSAHGIDAKFPSRAFLLLALLLLKYPSIASRVGLAADLWETSLPTQANASLRKLLEAIRRWEEATQTFLVDASFETIVLAPRRPETDLDQFLSMRPPRSAVDLARLAEVYRGDLLAGIRTGGSVLEGWLASQRHSLDARFRAFVGEASEQVACPAAEAALRRIADEHPYDDQACQGLMRYLARTGSREAALSVFDQFYKRVVDDLSAMPLPETLDLARSLRIFPRKTRRQSVTVGRVPVQTGPAPLPRVLIMAPSPEAVSAAVPIGRLLPIRALVEDVTLTLCRTREITVLAPHTAAEAASAVSPQLATLGVDYAVWTSVLGTRRNPFLAAKVVRPESSEIVWFDSVSLGPLCAREDRLHEAATWLGSAIAASIQRSELRLLGHQGRLAGYRHYLMGRRQLREISLESVRRARKWFRLAAHLNPDFAAPHSWIAQSYVLEWMIFSHGTTDILESAVLSAQRAIEIDPQDPTGHRALGRAALFLHRYEDSLRFFSDAENFAPNHADILAEHADTLMHNSRPREAWQRIERALDLNPLAPDVYRWIAGGILFFNQRPLEALEQLRLMRRPDQAYRLMAACAASAGMSAAARTYARKAMENDPDFSLRTWTSRLPQRDRSTLNMYVDALKAAGFV